jgi:superoxide dismutase
MTQVVATAQGSAWAILSYEPAGKRLFLQQLYTHQDNHLIGAVPLLCIDAWEHAYYLQYKNVKGDYAKAIWNVVDWTTCRRDSPPPPPVPPSRRRPDASPRRLPCAPRK